MPHNLGQTNAISFAWNPPTLLGLFSDLNPDISPPHICPGWGVGVYIDSCISPVKQAKFALRSKHVVCCSVVFYLIYLNI